MQISTITLSIAAAFASTVVVANNCADNFVWCGSDLLGTGDYRGYIQNKLIGAGVEASEFNIQNSAWKCLNDGQGNADYITICTHLCQYGGAGQNDYCLN
ncbi:hypothetical protein K505DRAFT_362954 [Melanomma pulvis-pyrius CBS 109.77]|uniref:Uncharacterized protein n=1 Tax=Melanomma pulvis-pyrius CBS 109.77 TaxID=1314802 RepID=A0A6A6X8B3_9PLEO|nr:hypothetical protein K505DRAFT_362954 [Melanomma pulvis-pyrius CBS 109.77]